MGNVRLAKNACVLAVGVALALAPATARAGGPGSHARGRHAPACDGTPPGPPIVPGPGGAAVPGCCYTFPIQAVYQCPAVIANQPGSRVVWLMAPPEAGLLGGQPYLYHP